ncbi:ATP-binding cassette domain-containing protein [Helicobacter felis]|uniref:ATP-binding cassette domain-containing protein n=1 Tax=Helicobacter felis TaxID=214 RepID=UPI000CF0A6BF|nr:ATP-binding cassette domain-containing protein [Helicobacter felis]
MSLQVVGLQKSYGEERILQDIHLEIRKGEAVTLMGASGSGKSTLVKCIARLESFNGGQILYQNEDILTIPHKRFRQTIQYVFQDQFNALNPAKRVSVLLSSVCQRFKSHDLLETILQHARLKPALLSSFPRELSGGERQRLGIARAMLTQAPILLLDEVTSALDKRLKYEIMDVLMDYQKSFNTTIICITHDGPIAQKYFKRHLILEKGRLVE